MSASETAPPPSPERERALEILRALRRFHRRLTRKVEARRGDLAEAERAPLLRRSGETLLAYLRQVPARARSVAIPDPHEPARTLEITLDPALSAQANAARYFKRAAKAERALGEIPPRIAAAEAEAHAIGLLLASLAPAEDAEITAELERALGKALAALPPALHPEAPRGGGATREPSPARVAAGDARAPSARLQPRRL